MPGKSKSSTPTRRKFLTQTGTGLIAAGAAATLLDRAAAAQAPADDPNRKIGFAMVGLGGFALGQLLPAFKDCKRARVTALVSGDANKARKVADKYGVDAKTGIYNYENFDTIENNPDVDVVYVVLPNGMHAEYTIRAAKAGKHVLCEKPMATSSAECREMIAACKDAGKKLMIGYRVRYEPHNIEAIRICKSGEIGRVVAIASDHGFPLQHPGPWRLNKKLAGGGPLMDIGIYALNATRYLTGENPVEITAQTFTPPNHPAFTEVEESCVWTSRFPSGVLATCTTSYGYQPQNRYRVMGTNGHVDLEPATAYGGLRMTKVVNGRMQRVQLGEFDEFAAEMDHLAECVQQNKDPLTPGEEGLADQIVMEAIYESARTGKTVKLGT
jgi:predicted dehydrogenase